MERTVLQMRDGMSSDVNKTDWVGRAFRISRTQAAGLVVLGLAFSWTATRLLGGAGKVPPHWFYIPILIAAVRFGVAGTLMTAVAAGVLAGPFVHLDVAEGITQELTYWTSRTGFFIGNGAIMALIIGRLKTSLGRELDLTKAEQELARHKEAVIQTVSHEFRTPLTVIIGTAEFLAEPGIVSEAAQPLVVGLELHARRLKNLIDMVLAAAGAVIDPVRKGGKRVVLRDLCQRAAKEAEAPEGARIRFEAAPDAEVVVCDPDLLAILLQAVIDNALKFSPPSSPVDISARRLADAVEVCVRDSGPGMSETDRVRAFEPFTQKDESTVRPKGGLGLGLFVARKTVELLGGTLELRPAEERGIEAIITIPQ
jgi:signal transduction histidine kinase